MVPEQKKTRKDKLYSALAKAERQLTKRQTDKWSRKNKLIQKIIRLQKQIEEEENV